MSDENIQMERVEEGRANADESSVLINGADADVNSVDQNAADGGEGSVQINGVDADVNSVQIEGADADVNGVQIEGADADVNGNNGDPASSLMGRNQEADTDKKDKGTNSKWDLLHMGIMSLSSLVVDVMVDDNTIIYVTKGISWIMILLYFGIFLIKVHLKRGGKCCCDCMAEWKCRRRNCSGLKVMVFVQKVVYTVYLMLSLGLVSVMIMRPNQSEAIPTPTVMVMVSTPNLSEAIPVPSNHSLSGGYSPGGQ